MIFIGALFLLAMIPLDARVLLGAPPPPPPKLATESNGEEETAGPTSTRVAIDGTQWTINGVVTSPGALAEGLLINMRLANGVFDDENPDTAIRWAYPDTGVWDAERNTRELLGNLTGYRAAGVHAITVGLQGGSPECYGGLHVDEWIVSAFDVDGSLKPAWLARLDTLLRAADAAGLVVIVSYFYGLQFDRLKQPHAALAAITAWLLQTGLSNLLVEVFNEYCEAEAAAYINEVHTIAAASGRVLPTTTSCLPGQVPPEEVIVASDYLLLHTNGIVPENVRSVVDWTRRQRAYMVAPKPIVINEDDPRTESEQGHFGDDSNLGAAVAANASWGFLCCCGATALDWSSSNYEGSVGFQCPPVNYGLRGQCHSNPRHDGPHMAKEEWFAAVARLTAA